MILVLGGTREGREAAVFLQRESYPVLITTVSRYGGELAAESGVRQQAVGTLDLEGMLKLIQEERVEAVVDATHPFARQIKGIAREACGRAGIPYIRFARAEAKLPESPLLYRVGTLEESVAKALQLGERIFLTIGSKGLPLFVERARQAGKRVIARVLPDPQVVAECINCGLSAKEIIAMQGPFSRETNRALYREYGADVLVSKDSGEIGGTLAKVEAALDLGLPVVLIGRPPEEKGAIRELSEMLREIKRYCGT